MKRAPTPPKASTSETDEDAFLRRYRELDYARPAVTVDIAVFTISESELQVLLIRRNEHPYRDRWALPGGFVRVGDAFDDQGEDLDQAAARELREETGLPDGAIFFEQLYTFGEAYRDPRTRVITVAYYALIPPQLAPSVHAGSDAKEAAWHALRELKAKQLAFDHASILDTALRRLRGKLDYSTIAFQLVPESFSIAELRAVHEIIEGNPLDPGNFRRRFNRLLEDGAVVVAPGKRLTGSRPAKLYRFVADAPAG